MMRKQKNIPYGPRREGTGAIPPRTEGFAPVRPAQGARAGRGAHAGQGARRMPAAYAPQAPAGGFSGVDAQDYARARYGTAAHGAGKGGRGGRKKSTLWTVVLVVAALVLAASLAVLGVIGYGYWHGSKVYDDIAQQAFPAKEADALTSMTVDWDALYAQNPDTVGWIYMPGTSIDYPIVQGDSDEEYLKKDFTGDSGGLVHKGAIFLAADNAADMSDQNNVIYGHNMNDDTMFAHVLQMTDQAAFDAARTFYILTPTQNYRCSTYAIDVVESTQTSLLQYNFADQSALGTYMTSRVEGSAVTPPNDLDMASVSKLFTLITCGDDYATTRAVLFGAVVEAAEPANASAAS